MPTEAEKETNVACNDNNGQEREHNDVAVEDDQAKQKSVVLPITLNASTTTKTNKKKKKKIYKTISIRDRLLSIQYDVNNFVRPILEQIQEKLRKEAVLLSSSSNGSNNLLLPTTIPIVVANERCGTWYSYPFQQQQQMTHSSAKNDNNNTTTTTATTKSCYFKSTDGHEWNFSLKRLNLDLLSLLLEIDDDGKSYSNNNNKNNNIICILDSSASKDMPDSFSRTIPLWTTVINRITEIYRNEEIMKSKVSFNSNNNNSINKNNSDNNIIWDDEMMIPDASRFWDNQLYLPINQYHSHNNNNKSNNTDQNNDSNNRNNYVKSVEEILIQDRVTCLYNSNAIVNPKWLVSTIQKPLRPFWITPSAPAHFNDQIIDDIISHYSKLYTCIVCINCSNISLFNNNNNRNHTNNNIISCCPPILDFTYIPGAADDHESWCCGLTPYLFWNNIGQILQQQQHQNLGSAAATTTNNTDKRYGKDSDNNNEGEGKYSDDNNTATMKQQKKMISVEQKIIARIVQQHHKKKGEEDNQDDDKLEKDCYDWIGSLNIAIGTRRAGRPPECWNNFDAILNVTDMEYPDMTTMQFQTTSIDDDQHPLSRNKRYYLQMPVREGKRDKTELEQWLSVGIIFIVHHAINNNRKVLIHCAQGMDRSVAVVMATLQLFANYQANNNEHEAENHSPTLLWNVEDNTLAHLGSRKFFDALLLFATTTKRSAGNHDFTTNKSLSKMSEEERYFNTCQIDTTNNVHSNSHDDTQEERMYRFSGLPKSVVREYLGRQGRDRLLKWIRYQQGRQPRSQQASTGITDVVATVTTDLATKDSLRIILHQIRQYRGKAEPSRSTMQKLNRYFMSQAFE